MAEDGHVDFLIGQHKTNERLAYLDYLEPPYLKDKVVIFFRKDAGIKSIQDLYDRPGAGLIGDAGIGLFKDYLAEKNINYKKKLYEVPDIESVFKLLEANRVQYTVYGLNAGLCYIKKSKVISYMDTPFPEREIYFAIAKKSKLMSKKKEIETQYAALLKKVDIDKMVKIYLDISSAEADHQRK